MATIFYNSPPPEKPWKYWVKKIAARILFPPILLWDALKVTTNYFFGVRLSKLILPSQSYEFYNKERYETQLTDILRLRVPQHYPHSQIDRVNIITHDGAILDGIQISPAKKSDDYIINFFGNGTLLEHMLWAEHTDWVKDYHELGVNIIGFNYRNVSQSQGIIQSENDLITDGIAQVQRLLDKHVPPENIYLKGMSLGGAISAMVAAHFHDLGIEVKCFNRSSFSNITNVVTGFLRSVPGEDNLPVTGYTETRGRKIIATLLKPIIKLGLILSGWDMDAGSAFARLPIQDREYMLVRSSRELRESLEPRDDTIITHYASIHMALKKERRKHKDFIDTRIQELEQRPFPVFEQNEKNSAIQSLRKLRGDMRVRKMMTADPSFNGHHKTMADLIDPCYSKTGNDFFWDFFRRSKMLKHNPLLNMVESVNRTSGVSPL